MTRGRAARSARPIDLSRLSSTEQAVGHRRVDLYCQGASNAVCLAIERATRCMVAPMMKMSHEGFGRVVLIAGRLIVVNRNLRDVHRFGFPSLVRLAESGDKLVGEAISMIEKFPEVANWG